ncbi:hypothetical protein ACFQ5N_08885 [Lutibacter holmesii]|uniref:Lipoprotein n=1 Tax=Lutibacter holmesii TaxID=1137985 RepID=A0ABW3WQM9_9FLAO
MKKLMLKLGILMIMVLSISMISCSDDSDDTFLGRFDGTQWEFFKNGESQDIFFEFNDNIKNPVTEWFDEIGSCYYKYNWAAKVEFEVLENSYDTFIVKCEYNDGYNTTVYNFTVIDGEIVVQVGVSDDGYRGSYAGVLLDPTTNIDDLSICY